MSAAALGLALLLQAATGSVADSANYCIDATSNDLCPDIMHTIHQNYMNDCDACHKVTSSFIVSGTFFKDSAKPAFQPGGPAPLFTKSGAWNNPKTAEPATCSNIACHNVPAGNFTYYIWDWGLDEAVPVTIQYGGMSSATAKWLYDNASNCDSCHGSPPKNYSYVWHSGQHGNSMIGANNCETCHPDAKSSTTVDGKTILSNYVTAPSQHANGTVDVVAKYTSKCFGCH
ncbi:hypothetical protein GMST_28430 [Geomonas silvestris]|uniref:Cytochrome c n=1 Tax=Geomonas silvestris TaxID=2740184 RepID=A0A6V8MKK5_9BACT|nr:hypothetical protein GMST_28430 [Geomonas silvestris]